ncbi:MAG: alpha/beta fold hydrolase BchO [Sphingomonadaceae bacterium]
MSRAGPAPLDWARDGADWPQREASRFVSAGGLDWHVQVAGSGPKLLLLHGTGASTHSWRALWPLLSDYRRIAVDLPGHGFTSVPADLSLGAMARALRALLAALDFRPDAIVGHSAGAAIAMRLVLDGVVAPRLVAGIGAALQPFPGPAAFLFPSIARSLVMNPLVPALVAATASLPGEPRRFLERATGSRIDEAGARLYGRLFRNHAHVASTLGMMAAWDLAPLVRDMPRLGVPLLLLHGTRDRTIPADVSVKAARQVPDGRAVLLPGLGHLAHEEAPVAVAGPLRAALAEAGPAAAKEEGRP